MSPCALPFLAHFVPVAALILAVPSQLSEKALVPDVQAQDSARKMANEIYGGRFQQAKTAAEKAVLATEMTDVALTVKDGTADQYILLDIAREVAAGAGEALTAVKATDRIAERFDVPAAKLKAESLLNAANRAVATAQHKAIAEAALSVAAELLDADEFDTAIKLCEAGQSSAKKAREIGILKQLAGGADELARRQKVAQVYRDALAVMEDKPAEPAANLAAGRYLCFVKGEAKQGKRAGQPSAPRRILVSAGRAECTGRTWPPQDHAATGGNRETRSADSRSLLSSDPSLCTLGTNWTRWL